MDFNILVVTLMYQYGSLLIAPFPCLRLTSSDHRRVVRPKLRQKASSNHLKILKNRKDVSTEISTPKQNGEESPSLDPNTYATYMSE